MEKRERSVSRDAAAHFLVNIDVPDLDPAVAFYTQAFQLEVGRRFGGVAVELLGGSSSIYLLVKPDGSTPSEFTDQLRSYGRHWTPLHLDWVVPDIDAAVERAMAAGAVLERPVRTSKWGKLAVLADPFGHGFCFLEFVGRGYDEVADR